MTKVILFNALNIIFILKTIISKRNTNDTLKSQDSLTVLILTLTLLMLPALGVPSEELLQDTFKSILLSLGVLTASFTYLWHQHNDQTKLVLHPIFFIPTLLCLYAFGSMAWAHTYLAGVEATRWLILSFLLILVANFEKVSDIKRLIIGIHIGATIASVWTALQFWFDFSYFPQGPNPASTFINRNFFAEYSVTVTPLSIYLLMNAKKVSSLNAVAVTFAFNLVALMMSGTRSALVTLPFIILLAIVVIRYYWRHYEISKQTRGNLYTTFSLVILIIGILGIIPTENKSLIREFGVQSPITRAINRTASITKPAEYTSGSFSIRSAMWRSTWSMVSAHPISGIGAGAWEVEAPLYQTGLSQVETDFYAHNELLQLLAEYGITGGIAILLLGLYIIASLKTTYQCNVVDTNYSEYSSLRPFCLFSLLALLAVSNAGFPFRLAGTGALFAVCLGMLANIDIRSSAKSPHRKLTFIPSKLCSKFFLLICGTLIIIATFVSTLAIECERNLVRAVKLALTITNSRDPNNPYWDKTKEEVLTLLKSGISINPHYRKLTPMAADEMASWGDWKNAIWIWDSVLQPRPYVIALSANIAKGYLQLGDIKNARLYLLKAAAVQSNVPAVRSLEAQILAKEERYVEAGSLIKQLFKEGFYDYDLVYTGYIVGNKARDLNLIVDSLQLRLKNWPQEATDSWVKLGDVYSQTDMRSEEKALFCYQMALQSVPNEERELLLAKIPSSYKMKLRVQN